MERLWISLTSDYREALKTMTGSGVPFVNLVRSEEHTSELQSH